MTLKSITDNLAYRLGEQFNDVLKKSIEDSIIEYRALFLRQTIQKDGANMQHFMNSFCVEMELIDNSECPGIKTGVKVLRSKQELPKALRVKGWGRSSYRYVGSLNRLMPFTYAVPDEIPYYSNLDFQEENVFYALYNNRLYLLNRTKACKVFVEGVIEDPRDINDCNYPELMYDEVEFSLPADLVPGLKRAIYEEYNINILDDGEEIHTDKDS